MLDQLVTPMRRTHRRGEVTYGRAAAGSRSSFLLELPSPLAETMLLGCHGPQLVKNGFQGVLLAHDDRRQHGNIVADRHEFGALRRHLDANRSELIENPLLLRRQKLQSHCLRHIED